MSAQMEAMEDNKLESMKENLQEIEQRIRNVDETIQHDIKEKRAELNAEKKALISGLESDYGLNADALAAAMKRASLTEKKLANFDLTYEIACKALGVTHQDDWVG